MKKLLRTKKIKKDIALIMKSHFFNKEGACLHHKLEASKTGQGAGKCAAEITRSVSHGQDSFGLVSVDFIAKKGERLGGEPIRLKN